MEGLRFNSRIEGSRLNSEPLVQGSRVYGLMMGEWFIYFLFVWGLGFTSASSNAECPFPCNG